MNENTEDQEFRLFDGLPLYRSEYATVSTAFNCGPGLANDRVAATAEDSYLSIISKTTEKEFEAFLESVSSDQKEYRSDEAGRYCSFRLHGELYYAYYIFSEHCARIIHDVSSNHIPSSLNAGTAGGRISLYQYSLNYVEASVPYAEPGAMDCGMLYIFRFPDGSLFLIDSAHGMQTTQGSLDGLYAFLRKISGIPEKQKIPVRGWFFTHAHGDHTGMAAAFLGETYPGIAGKQIRRSYAEQLEIQSVLFNFPSYQIATAGYAADESMAMKDAFRNRYPGIPYIKLHTGQSFSLFGMQFEVLYTFEDSVTPEGEWGLTEFNSTSTVLKATYGNTSVLFLADIHRKAEGILMRRYSEKTLASDVVQVAHHCINELDIYEKIQAEYALVPTSHSQMVGRHARQYARFRDFAQKGCYCADACTWEMCLNGTDIQTQEHPRYDACGYSDKPQIQKG